MPEEGSIPPGPGTGVRLGAAVWAGVVLAMALVALTPHPGAKLLGMNGAGAALALLSAAACGRRARSGPRSEAGAWTWIALAMGVQAAGHGVILLDYLRGVLPSPGADLSDLIFLAVLPALFASLVLWPHRARSTVRTLRTALDAFIFGGSILFVSWQLGLRDMVRAHPDGTALVLLLSVLLVCLDFGYWAYLVLPFSRWPRGPLGYLGLALGGACVVNLASTLVALAGTYHPGHWTDLLTLPVLALPAFAAWSPFEAPPQEAPEETPERPGGVELLLPFLPVVVGLMVVLVQVFLARDRLDWQTSALAGVVVAVLILRQFLTLWDLERLSSNLEARVQERTLELDQAREVLVRTERLNAMATLGAGLAHDIKNLIGVVRNYAMLVHRDLQEARVPELEDLEAIQLASSQAVELANQLMNYGRSESDPVACFDLVARVRQLGAMLEAILPEGIGLELDLPEQALVLKENPFHLDQMVVNLVLNARDALPQGGTIRLAAHPIRLDERREGVRLEVSDNGVGLSPEAKAHLFEPFFTTKPFGEGTGIGLASVKAALRGFGGQIQVDSEPGRGARFTILLPLG